MSFTDRLALVFVLFLRPQDDCHLARSTYPQRHSNRKFSSSKFIIDPPTKPQSARSRHARSSSHCSFTIQLAACQSCAVYWQSHIIKVHRLGEASRCNSHATRHKRNWIYYEMEQRTTTTRAILSGALSIGPGGWIGFLCFLYQHNRSSQTSLGCTGLRRGLLLSTLLSPSAL